MLVVRVALLFYIQEICAWRPFVLTEVFYGFP